MADIYNQRFDKPTQPNSNTATLFSIDFDDPNLTLLQITNGLRDIVQGGSDKQIAVYISHSSIDYANIDKSYKLYHKVIAMLAFLQSYSNLSTSFILRGSLGWEFIPLLVNQTQVYLTSNTTVTFDNTQLSHVAFCLKDNPQVLRNVIEEVANMPIYCKVYSVDKLTQLGFNILQYS